MTNRFHFIATQRIFILGFEIYVPQKGAFTESSQLFTAKLQVTFNV